MNKSKKQTTPFPSTPTERLSVQKARVKSKCTKAKNKVNAKLFSPLKVNEIVSYCSEEVTQRKFKSGVLQLDKTYKWRVNKIWD